MPYIDFQALKERVTIEQAAALLGLKLNKSGNQLRGACPACKQGGDRALAITPARGLFFCFGNQKGGDAIQLVAHVRGCTLPEAAEFLGGTSTNSASTSPSPEHKGMVPLDYLDPDHEAVEAAGLDPETARFIGAGYAPKGVLRGTVAIPIRDEHGTLLGYVGIQELKLPPKGLLPHTNVVPLKQRA